MKKKTKTNLNISPFYSNAINKSTQKEISVILFRKNVQILQLHSKEQQFQFVLVAFVRYRKRTVGPCQHFN